ncbi:MAG TPA: hypothetical protein HA304_03905 [Methanosarcinales archaeon]|nr:hypothetical protein [Methanosarcinales archaeon]
MILIGLAIAPAAAQIPFEITGYVHLTDGSACLDPTVTITNMDTGAVLPVMTVPSSSYYMVKPAPLQNEINEGDVLEFRASAGTESTVMEHRILASDLNNGALYLNITLGTAVTTTGSGVGDPPLPQAPTISTPDTTATITPDSTSTEATSSPSQEKQTPGFKIVPASAAMVACLLLVRRLL